MRFEEKYDLARLAEVAGVLDAIEAAPWLARPTLRAPVVKAAPAVPVETVAAATLEDLAKARAAGSGESLIDAYLAVLASRDGAQLYALASGDLGVSKSADARRAAHLRRYGGA